MFWFHGLGVCLCPARGRVRWGKETEDYDAVECLAFFFMPILPVRVVHVTHGPATLGRAEEEIRQFPLRWTPGVIARAFLGRWLWGAAVAAAVFFLMGMSAPRPGGKLAALTVGLIFLGIFALGRLLLRRSDRRTRAIRFLLGRHHFGSSDPAFWPMSRFKGGSDPEGVFDTKTYAEAVPKLLAAGEFSRAMWAARLACATEDRSVGEELTDTILQEPAVQDAVEVVEGNPYSWRRVMVGGEV